MISSKKITKRWFHLINVNSLADYVMSFTMLCSRTAGLGRADNSCSGEVNLGSGKESLKFIF